MTDYVFAPPEVPSVAVAGTDARLPVRRIFCVGRNYAAHAREMGRDPDREPPFFFTKPADAVVDSGVAVPYPPLTRDLHYEGELVVAIATAGREVPVEAALGLVWGYGVGNDLTRRDLQREAREAGRPWDWAKAFDRSAVCGPLSPATRVGHVAAGSIRTTVNGDVRQDADVADMIWTVPEVVSILSHAVEIRPGDLVFTGTPAGVGPVVAGDVVAVAIDRLGAIETRIAPAVAAA